MQRVMARISRDALMSTRAQPAASVSLITWEVQRQPAIYQRDDRTCSCSYSTTTVPTGAPVSHRAASEFRVWAFGGGVVHRTANVSANTVVEAGAVVGAGATVGDSCRVGSASVVGADVTLGARTSLGCNVSLSNCTVGEDCVLHHGVAVGQDGFGFFFDAERKVMTKKPQLLRVVIGDRVEIGASTCVDRGSWRDTVIGSDTKIDNLVQVAHNVRIGRNCLICGQAGLAGSASLGDFVTLGGRAAVADHVSVCSKVRIAAMAGVTKNIVHPGDYAGFPAAPAAEWRRGLVAARRSPLVAGAR